ncbi:hypothetical protein DRJ17_00045 [Candidatus Woesearchaeota archaeon]|nr:MAG: hypothetical protein DRJ17_00045 [Candidatus Woesearchaeota archaeon]
MVALKEVKSAVLLVIVLIVVVALVFPVIRDTVKEMLGYQLPELESPVFAPEEQQTSVRCTAEAIAFAADFLSNPSKQRFNEEKKRCGCELRHRCEDGEKIGCKDGVAFGQICLKWKYLKIKKMENGESVTTGHNIMKLENLVLPQDVSLSQQVLTEFAPRYWFTSTTKGPKFLTYYEHFPEDEAASWVIAKSNIDMSPNMFSRVNDLYQAMDEMSQASRVSEDTLGLIEITPNFYAGLADIWEPISLEARSGNMPFMMGMIIKDPSIKIEGKIAFFSVPFYLASPCKTDAIMVFARCKCDLPAKSDMPIFQKKIKLDGEEYSIPYRGVKLKGPVRPKNGIYEIEDESLADFSKAYKYGCYTGSIWSDEISLPFVQSVCMLFIPVNTDKFCYTSSRALVYGVYPQLKEQLSKWPEGGLFSQIWGVLNKEAAVDAAGRYNVQYWPESPSSFNEEEINNILSEYFTQR